MYVLKMKIYKIFLFRIRYPGFNCIWVGSKKKTIYFPAELLEVTYGQVIFHIVNVLTNKLFKCIHITHTGVK